MTEIPGWGETSNFTNIHDKTKLVVDYQLFFDTAGIAVIYVAEFNTASVNVLINLDIAITSAFKISSQSYDMH